jgi:hypothetical protein
MFSRLDEFFDSAVLHYKALGYGGPLHIHMSLEKISDRKLIGYLEGTKALGGDYNCLDPQVYHEQVAVAHSLGEQKFMLIQDIVQRIGWAYNWVVTPELLNSYYEFKKPKAERLAEDR